MGTDGDLVQVKSSEKASDGSSWITHTSQYRYYSDGDSGGGDHQLKAVFEADAVERMIADNVNISSASTVLTKADSYATGGSAAVEDFSSRSFTYYTSSLNTSATITTPWGSENLNTKYGGSNILETDWVKTETVHASCSSCGGDTPGGGLKRTYFYMYLPQPSSVSEVTRIVVEDTEESGGEEAYRRIFGLNKHGKVLRRTLIENPTAATLVAWCDSVKLTTASRVSELRKPSAHDVTDNADMKKFLDPEGGSPAGQNDTDTLNASEGAIFVFEHNGDDRRTGTRLKNGRSGTSYYISATDWGDGIATDEPEHLPVARYRYPTKTTVRGSGVVTDIDYDFWDTADTQIKVATTTLPAIPGSQNGSNVRTETKKYFDDLGRLRWVKDGEGNITYHSYHPELGGLAYTMVDVETDSLPSDITSGVSGKYVKWVNDSGGSTAPSEFSNTDNDNLEIVTKTEYDDLGRSEIQIDANGFEHHTVYEDGRTIEYPFWNGSSGQPERSIEVVETDGAGNVVDQFTMTPSQATSTGSSPNKVPSGISDADNQNDYLSWTHFGYGVVTGELIEEDRYFDIPSSINRDFGTLSTHFHRTAFKYDGLGREKFIIDVVSGTLTSNGVEQITQKVYDVRDRRTSIKRGISGSSHNMGSNYAIPTTGIDTVEER